jgi:hypothetical protein
METTKPLEVRFQNQDAYIEGAVLEYCVGGQGVGTPNALRSGRESGRLNKV